MNIKIEGNISDKSIIELLGQTNVKLVLDQKVNEKIDSIINKHFNAENADQSIRENFNKSINRFSNTDEFKDLIVECLAEKIKIVLDSKEFSKIIDQSCKKYIDNIISNLKN